MYERIIYIYSQLEVVSKSGSGVQPTKRDEEMKEIRIFKFLSVIGTSVKNA